MNTAREEERAQRHILMFGQNLQSALAVFVQSVPGVGPVKGNDRCDIGIICSCHGAGWLAVTIMPICLT